VIGKGIDANGSHGFEFGERRPEPDKVYLCWRVRFDQVAHKVPSSFVIDPFACELRSLLIVAPAKILLLQEVI